MSPAPTLHESDLVVSGGGSHGIAEVACIRALSRHVRFRRVGGSSIGAIIAAGLALGFTPDFMLGVFKRLLTRGLSVRDCDPSKGYPANQDPSLEDWKYPKFMRPLGMLQGRGGMMRGDVLRRALSDVFGKAQMGSVQLPLRIKVASMSRRKTETVYSDVEMHKRLSIVDVCMCSAAVPGLIDNQQLDPRGVTRVGGPGGGVAGPVATVPDPANELYCDGGTGNNVPRAMWDDPDGESRPTTIVRFLDDERLIPAVSALEKANAYWNIARDAAEGETSKKPPAFVWDIPIKLDGNALDFSLTPAECERRIGIGHAAGLKWIEENTVHY